MIKKQKVEFHSKPKWLNIFKTSTIDVNSSEYHYYSNPSANTMKITLREQESIRQITREIVMYYDFDDLSDFQSHIKDKDSTGLKDFSYLDFLEGEMLQQIQINPQGLVKQSSWVRKYEPQRFVELLTDELINRNILTWMKSWDKIVFHKENHKIEQIPSLFVKNPHLNSKNSNFVPVEYSFKKLILLAGPPGCGKTTLARTVARHCGYNYEQINASDDRSAKSLISKIQNLVSNRTIRLDQKPACIIIDEVDGALDSDSNGLKQVLHYIETGDTKKQKIKSEKQNNEKSKDEKDKKKINKGFERKKGVNEEEKRRTKIDRPIIFICNDPFVKGLKELRSKAIVVYFNNLQEDRVVKRLKEIAEKEKIYIESDVFIKISNMCNHDIRSAVGLLELVCNQKLSNNTSPRQFIGKLKVSMVKDSNSSIHDFVQKLLMGAAEKENDKHALKNMQYFMSQTTNYSLLEEMFVHNMIWMKNFFSKLENTCHLYSEIRYFDYLMKEGFRHNGELDQFLANQFMYYKLKFRPEDYNKRIEFPNIYFERINKLKTNKAIIEKVLANIQTHCKVNINFKRLAQSYIYLFYLTMQTSSTREDEVFKCVGRMITYGIEFQPRNHHSLFNPEIDLLLTFGGEKPEIVLSNTSRKMIEESFDFVKIKSLLLVENVNLQSNRNSSDAFELLAQMKKNKKRKRNSEQGVVKYKYLEGTGTEVKYELKIGYFFSQK